MKVNMRKARPIEQPYEVRAEDGWEWRVLKSYHNDTDRPYARAYCAVSSPYIHGYEYGDVYWSDIVNVPVVESC